MGYKSNEASRQFDAISLRWAFASPAELKNKVERCRPLIPQLPAEDPRRKTFEEMEASVKFDER